MHPRRCQPQNRPHKRRFPANSLNQITNRDVPAYVDILGASLAATVNVNGTNANRKGEYFWDELPVNNTNSPLWTNIIVAATNQTSVTGHVFVAQEPETFKYDADGNLTNDGRWAYTWDGENRLKGMTVNTNVGPQYQLTFAYDSQGRRIQKIVATNGVAYSTNDFLYDGWNLIAEVGTSGSLVRSYMWGTDLSGSMQGAGGVGGLLEVSYSGTNCFPAFDGNGNVAALINAADGTAAANYDYGPFGEVIRSTGLMAKNNPFRFSTKYNDDESDLLYYGYRFYKPSTGTWPNHDPLGEPGFEVLRGASVVPRIGQVRSRTLVRGFIAEKKGPNLYAFVKNDPESKIDLFGLDDEPDVSWAPAPCPNSQKTIFIQVFYGGWGPYSGPRTDDGSAGFFGGGSKGCPDYNPPGMDPGVFQDSPSGTHGWLTGPVQFIVCRVCEQQCCNGGWKIASIGPCVYWKKGDKGDLSDSGTFTTVDGPPQTWQVGLQNNYPDYANGGCAKCKN